MLNQDKKNCVEYYKQAAANYDVERFNCPCRLFIDNLFKKTVLDLLRDCDDILDAGTGTGRFAIFLAKNGKRVIAVDSSKEMLEKAWQNAEKEGVADKIDFRLGDIENLPLQNASVDGISCIHVLVHYQDINRPIEEFSRVLRKEGLLVFEVANKGYSRFYNRIWALVRRKEAFSFPDYYHDFGHVVSILTKNRFKVNASKRIKKIPKIFLHFAVCLLRQRWLLPVLRKLEEMNYGTVKIIQGIKIA